MGIHMEGVTFAYAERPVLCGVDLHVEPGDIVGIVGESGGGKSTLLKVLCGLYAPHGGFVEVHGMRAPEDIRRHVAVVLQNAMLFPGSIRDNVTCGHPMADERVLYACQAAQLGPWLDTLPQGLDAPVGERGGQVSGGQAQRIAIARAIAKDAPVVLLDEATSALDGDTRAAVLEALARLTQGKTVVHVTHHSHALVGCSRIYRLEGGRLRNA